MIVDHINNHTGVSGESRVDGLEQPPIDGDYVALRDLEWKSLEDRRMRWGLGMLLHTQREGDYVGLTQLPGLVQQLTLSSKRVPDGNAFNRGVNDLNHRYQRAQTWKTWKSSSDEGYMYRAQDMYRARREISSEISSGSFVGNFVWETWKCSQGK